MRAALGCPDYGAEVDRHNDVHLKLQEAEARIVELEKHRDAWRRQAWHLQDLVREKNFDAAVAVVAESDEKTRNAYKGTPLPGDDTTEKR